MPRRRDTEPDSTIAAVIANVRTNAGLTQQKLAWRLNREQSFIAKIETGVRSVEVREFLWIVQRIGADPILVLSQLLQGDDFRDLYNRARETASKPNPVNRGVDDWDDYADVPDVDDDGDESALGNWRAPT